MTKPEQGTYRRRRSFVLLTLLVGLMLICGLLYYALQPDLKLRREMYIPDGAVYRYEAGEKWGGDSRQENLYYWSAQDIENVRVALETRYPPFEPGNSKSDWLITAVTSNGASVKTHPPGSTLGHESLCDYHWRYTCVTIILVDLRAHHVLDLPIAGPGTFRLQSPEPLYTFLDMLPSEGTLITYTYFSEAL